MPCNAKNVATTAFTLGNSTPTASPRVVNGANARPSAMLPVSNRP